MGAGERPGVEVAHMGAPAHFATNQSRVFQHLDVLRGGRERDVEGFCKLADCSLAPGEFAEYLPARGVAEPRA